MCLFAGFYLLISPSASAFAAASAAAAAVAAAAVAAADSVGYSAFDLGWGGI